MQKINEHLTSPSLALPILQNTGGQARGREGQAVTEWVFMMSIVVMLAAIVMGNFSEVIRGWYLGAGQIVAGAGVKK